MIKKVVDLNPKYLAARCYAHYFVKYFSKVSNEDLKPIKHKLVEAMIKDFSGVSCYDLVIFAASFVINLPRSAFDIKPENVRKFVKEEPCLQGCIIFCYLAMKLMKPAKGAEEKLIQLIDLCMTLILSAIAKNNDVESSVITSTIKEIHSFMDLIKSFQIDAKCKAICEGSCLNAIALVYLKTHHIDRFALSKNLLEKVVVSICTAYGENRCKHVIYGRILCNLAIICYNVHGKGASEGYIKKCLQTTRRPTNENIQQRAICERILGIIEDDIDLKEKHFEEGLRIMESHFSSNAVKYSLNGYLLLNLAVLYEDTNQNAKAKQCFQSALECIGEWQDRCEDEKCQKKAWCFYRLGKTEPDVGVKEFQFRKGIEEMRRHHGANVTNAKHSIYGRLLYNMGVLYEGMGNFESAKAYFEKCLTSVDCWTDRSQNDICHQKAWCLYKLGVISSNPETKEDMYLKGVNLMKDYYGSSKDIQHMIFAYLLLNLGLHYAETSRFDKAKQCFEQSLNSAVGSRLNSEADLCCHKALCHCILGVLHDDADKKKEHFNKGIAVLKDLFQANVYSQSIYSHLLFNLGMAHEDTSDISLAKECYSVSLGAALKWENKTNSEIYEHRARCYYR